MAGARSKVIDSSSANTMFIPDKFYAKKKETDQNTCYFKYFFSYIKAMLGKTNFNLMGTFFKQTVSKFPCRL